MTYGDGDGDGDGDGLTILPLVSLDVGSEHKPVGLVYIGVIGPEGFQYVIEQRFGSTYSRENIRRMSALTAMNLLRLILMKSRILPASLV